MNDESFLANTLGPQGQKERQEASEWWVLLLWTINPVAPSLHGLLIRTFDHGNRLEPWRWIRPRPAWRALWSGRGGAVRSPWLCPGDVGLSNGEEVDVSTQKASDSPKAGRGARRVPSLLHLWVTPRSDQSLPHRLLVLLGSWFVDFLLLFDNHYS